MILITGATGQLGKSTLDFLLKKVPSNQIAILARDANKAAELKAKGVDVRIGNYDDEASLVTAFENIDKLLFISGSDVANRLKQHGNVVNAAKTAGVKHIIYTSFARKNENGSEALGVIASSHIETDKLIKASGIPYTIMLNGLYADVLPMFFGDKVLETGIFLPAGEGKAAYTSRTDIAEAAANILTTNGHENKEYVIVNTTNYSLKDAADLLSDLSGKEVKYTDPGAEIYAKTLTAAGVPAEYIGMFAGFSEAIKQGEFESKTTDLGTILGRTPESLEVYFKSTYFSNN